MLKLGQRVRVKIGLDEGKEGKVQRVPTDPYLDYNVELDDGHVNRYPLAWLEATDK
jgi:hypothetical protein